MNIVKMLWGVRAAFYKLKFKKIGLPSYIGKPIYISNKANIICGKKVRIYPGMRAEIGKDKNSQLNIGDNVSIGQNFHVVSQGSTLTIGNDVTVAGNVFITNCDHDYKGPHKSILENKLIMRNTEIGDSCFLGNNVAILAGTKLGKGCIVGANSVLRGEFSAYSVIVGVPGKIISTYTKESK